jgi:hypothetical protein
LNALPDRLLADLTRPNGEFSVVRSTCSTLIRSACFATIWLFSAVPAIADPPMPDTRFNNFVESMRLLDPLIGTWEGAYDGMAVKARRVVARGPHGELYLCRGDSHRERLDIEIVDVLQVDESSNDYLLIRPGFVSQKNGQYLVPFQVPRAGMMQYDELIIGNTVATNRTTISVQDGIWHERVERVLSGGTTKPLYSITLKRVGDAAITFGPP